MEDYFINEHHGMGFPLLWQAYRCLVSRNLLYEWTSHFICPLVRQVFIRIEFNNCYHWWDSLPMVNEHSLFVPIVRLFTVSKLGLIICSVGKKSKQCCVQLRHPQMQPIGTNCVAW